MAMINPAPRLEQIKARGRWRWPMVNGVQVKPPTVDDARNYLARMEMDLPAIPPLAPLCWPPPKTEGMFSTARANQAWAWLASQPVDVVVVFLWVAQDWLLHLRSIAVPERRGRRKAVVRFVIERTWTYYESGRGDVNLDRRSGLDQIKNLLRPTAVSAACLREAGVKLRPGASRGHYLLTEDQRDDLQVLVHALEGHGLRIPAGVKPPRRSRAPDPLTEALTDTHGDRILCPVHEETDPSCVALPNGALYCWGKCNRFVGEWKDPADADWSVRPIYRRALRQQEKELGIVVPSKILVRLFTSTHEEDQSDRIQADLEPKVTSLDEYRKARDADQDRAVQEQADSPDRRIVFISSKPGHETTISGTPLTLAPSTRSSKPGRHSAMSAGAPGDHPLDRLHQSADAWRSESSWKGLRDRFPTYQDWNNPRCTQPKNFGSAIRAMGHLRCTQVPSARSTKGTMDRKYDGAMDLIDLQINADRHSRCKNVVAARVRAYDVATALNGGKRPDPLDRTLAEQVDMACEGVDLRDLRQQYVSVGIWKHSRIRIAPWRTRAEPDAGSFAVQGVRYILIDVDKVTIPESAGTATEAEREMEPLNLIHGGRAKRGALKGQHLDHGDRCLEAAAKVVQARIGLSSMLTGRMYLLRSGPNGVQAAVELRQTRWDPKALWACAKWREAVKALGAFVLDALHSAGCTGGFVDPSVNHASNLARRASWRVAKDGTLFRSRLIYTTPRRPWEA